MAEENIYAPPSASLEPTPIAGEVSLARPFRGLPKLVCALMLVDLITNISGSCFSWLSLLLSAEFMEDVPGRWSSVVGVTTTALDGAISITYLLCVIFFSKWIYRAHVNAKAYDYPMRFSPAWAVGSFFVPIVCIFRPYQAMKELWIASAGPRYEGTRELRVWWALWFVVGIVPLLLWWAIPSSLAEQEILVLDGVVELISIGLYILLYRAAATIVRTITEYQETDERLVVE